jgi:hypothetical protein
MYWRWLSLCTMAVQSGRVHRSAWDVEPRAGTHLSSGKTTSILSAPSRYATSQREQSVMQRTRMPLGRWLRDARDTKSSLSSVVAGTNANREGSFRPSATPRIPPTSCPGEHRLPRERLLSRRHDSATWGRLVVQGRPCLSPLGSSGGRATLRCRHSATEMLMRSGPTSHGSLGRTGGLPWGSCAHRCRQRPTPQSTLPRITG